MPDKPPYGVLLVSGGYTHQENYGPAFAADPRCRVVGVADEKGLDARRTAANRRLAEEMKIPLLDDLESALKRPDVHIVSVCSEHERQGRIGALAARMGKHIYMDKPMAGSLRDADRLVDASRMAGVRSQMFSQVNMPYALKAKRIVDSSRLGALQAIHCDLHFAKGWPGGAPLGKPRKETALPDRFIVPDAKREMFNIAVYSLVMIRWLTRREILTVRATTANYFFEENYRRNFEDFGMLSLGLEGGVTATITAGRIGWMSHINSGPNWTRLYGSKGSALIDGMRPRAETSSDLLTWKRPARDPEDPMGFWRSSQERAGTRPRPEWVLADSVPERSDQSLFVDCVETGREAEVNAFAGAKAVEALLAAYRSAATGEVVRLPLPR